MKTDLCLLDVPISWPNYPFLTITDRTGRCGLLIDFKGILKNCPVDYNFRTTVWLVNMFDMKEDFTNFVDLCNPAKKIIYTSPEEMTAAGWRID